MKVSLILLVAMIVVTAIVAVYRWIVTHHEDDFLHIEDPSGQVIANQRTTARELTRIDHIGVGLTVITAIYAVGLLIAFFYQSLH